MESFTRIDEPRIAEDVSLEVYPNSSAGNFYLRFQMKQKNRIEVILLDVNGRNQSILFSN